MRTTVTLDDDVAARLKELARERGISFKAALNASLRAGFAAERRPSAPYRLHPRPLGVRPGVDLDKALQLAAELEDAEVVRDLEHRQ